MATEAKPPAELGPEGKRLWRSVARAVAEDDLVLDPRELAWLRTA
jgi:phage terminase small subunit